MPLVELARDSWHLGFGTMRAMPNLFTGTFVLLLAFNLAFRWAHPAVEGWPGAAALLLGFAKDVALDVITTGALLAVHRSVLLGEGADRPVWRLPPTYDRYLAWLLLLDLLFLPVTLLDAWAGPGVPGQAGVGPAALAHLVLFLGAFWLTVRMALLPPLLAMGTPGAGWRMAWGAGRGQAWRMVGAALLAFVPLWIGASLVAGLFREVDGPAAAVLGAAGTALEALLGAAVTAALWSRLLQAYGGALGRKPVWT